MLWDRDDRMGPGVTAVRQNLGLIVDGGALVPGLADSNSWLWGGTVGNQIYVWRSGVGVDAHGNLVYAAGPGLNVETLAEILRRAGCVRAMELDINTWWVSFTEYTPDASWRPQCRRISSRRWCGPPDRYLTDGTRDFFEIDRASLTGHGAVDAFSRTGTRCGPADEHSRRRRSQRR